MSCASFFLTSQKKLSRPFFRIHHQTLPSSRASSFSSFFDGFSHSCIMRSSRTHTAFRAKSFPSLRLFLPVLSSSFWHSVFLLSCVWGSSNCLSMRSLKSLRRICSISFSLSAQKPCSSLHRSICPLHVYPKTQSMQLISWLALAGRKM